MTTSPRPSARGGIAARKIARQERAEGSLYERQALTDYSDIRARVLSEAVNCAICGQLVHPDNMSAHMQNNHPITIDPEFHELIPPQSEEETEALTASLLSEGCRDALVVWDETNTLIDGHHRYDICSEHGITYGINRKSFDSREDVIVWMISNQLSRRNVSAYARAELALRMKTAIAAKAKENSLSNLKKGASVPDTENSSGRGETREQLAKIAEVSSNTISKVESITNNAPAAITKRARAGDISVNRAYELTKALKDAPEIIVNFVTEHEIEEPDKVALLVKGYKEKREWCEELLTSEYIQPGAEYDAVHYSASILEWKKAIENRQAARAKIEMDTRRQERLEAIIDAAQAPALTDLPQRYALVYADPPWRYEHSISDSREIENHYPTMNLDDICAMPIQDITTDDAVLFMWATSPKLAEAMRVIEAWGFTYRTCMVWVKDRIGMGYYARQRHELLLIATRGSVPVPAPENRPDSVITAPRLEHSAKPIRFYELIESMYPELPKVELFSRVTRKGWQGWGYEYSA